MEKEKGEEKRMSFHLFLTKEELKELNDSVMKVRELLKKIKENYKEQFNESEEYNLRIDY